jgi:predicted  nucleic acid-binding Zn-ribbon protein
MALREHVRILSAENEKMRFDAAANAEEIQKLNMNLKRSKAQQDQLESELSVLQGELEDLCASLFSAANDMVSQERRSASELRQAHSDLQQQLTATQTSLMQE